MEGAGEGVWFVLAAQQVPIPPSSTGGAQAAARGMVRLAPGAAALLRGAANGVGEVELPWGW